MFNVGGGEVLVLLLIALIFLGPDKMPEAARKVGKMLGEVRRMTSGFQEEIRTAMDLDGSQAAAKAQSVPPQMDTPPEIPAPASPEPDAPQQSVEASDAPPDPERPPHEPDRGDTSAA